MSRCESGWSAMATDQVLFLSAPADHVRSDRLTRRFDAQAIVRARRRPWRCSDCSVRGIARRAFE